MQTIVLPQAPAPPLPDGSVIIGGGPPEWIAPVAVLTLVIIVAGILLFPMARAWARRLEAESQNPALLDEVNQLRERVADLEEGAGRMHELEERLDFAERMLARRDEQVRLPREGER